MKRKTCKAFFLSLLFWVPAGALTAYAAAPVALTAPAVSDVTTRGFSLSWVVDVGNADPHIHVYTEQDGVNDITPSLEVEAMPVAAGNAGQTPADLAESARSRGIQKIRVSGLDPDTTYYYRAYSSNLDGDTPFMPLLPDSLRTESKTRRSKDSSGDEVPFSNDLLAVEILDEFDSALDGGLVLLDVVDLQAPGSYPVSAFVGDGVARPYVLLDLNNLFDAQTRITLDLLGDEHLDLRILRGMDCPLEQVKYRVVPYDESMTEGKPLYPCFNYDILPMCTDNDCSGTVNIIDAQRVLDLMEVSYSDCDYNDDFDIDGSGIIDMLDVDEVFGQIRKTCN